MSSSRASKNRSFEAGLVAAILAGDDSRFDELYELYRGRVFGFVLRRVGCAADAEDITQEVFLQVHRSIASFKGRASLATWIFGIAHNVTCRHFRGNKNAMTVPLDTNEAITRLAINPYAERKLDAERAVRRCTETLKRARTPEHLEIFRMFYGLGKPLRVIAKNTGKPTDSIKDSLRRSRNLLLRDLPDVRSALVATAASA